MKKNNRFLIAGVMALLNGVELDAAAVRETEGCMRRGIIPTEQLVKVSCSNQGIFNQPFVTQPGERMTDFFSRVAQRCGLAVSGITVRTPDGSLSHPLMPTADEIEQRSADALSSFQLMGDWITEYGMEFILDVDMKRSPVLKGGSGSDHLPRIKLEKLSNGVAVQKVAAEAAAQEEDVAELKGGDLTRSGSLRLREEQKGRRKQPWERANSDVLDEEGWMKRRVSPPAQGCLEKR